MDPVTGFLLGLLQGVLEWLPISSSGWVGVASSWVSESDWLDLAFFLHFGTLLAVLVRLRGDVRDIVVELPKWRTDPLVRFILATTAISLPVGLVLVLILEEVVEAQELTGVGVTLLVGALLIVTGLVLRVARDKSGQRKVGDTGPLDWVILGLAQGFSALPGISRSGMTVSALLIKRVDAGESLRLSFLMSVPATIAVVAYELVLGDIASVGWGAVIAGVAAAFVLGYLTIEGLLRLAQRVRWDWFCVVFGLVAVITAVALAFF
jgi:undecaprenyl-diphosphatase